MELLNQSNYKVWKTCMESYLVGEDLWDIVNGNDTVLLLTDQNKQCMQEVKAGKCEGRVHYEEENLLRFV